MTETSTTTGARAHARAMGGTVVKAMPTVPASRAVDLPAGVEPTAVIWDEVLDSGEYAAHRLPRDAMLRLTDVGGDACAHVIIHNALNTAERLNLADTVKVQWQAYPTTGAQLLSDMGRVLMTIADDTSARHDTLCGAPLGLVRDRFVVAVAKAGLARRDIPPSMSFFKGVRVDPSGALVLDALTSAAGRYVDLYAELDVHVVVVNAPHVLDEREVDASPLRITAWNGRSRPAAASPATPERERALLNTEDWRAGLD